MLIVGRVADKGIDHGYSFALTFYLTIETRAGELKTVEVDEFTFRRYNVGDLIELNI